MTLTLNKLKPKRRDALFWLAYGMFLVFGILSTSFYYKYFMGTPYRVIKYSCLLLLVIRELDAQKYNIRSLIIGAVFVALVMITRSQASVSTVAFILIFLFCARNIDFREIARFSAIISSAVVLFVVISGYVGIIDNYVTITETRVRYYLGFRYVLYGPAFLFNITGLVLYLGGTSIKWRTLLILVIVNSLMFAQSRSRLSFYLSLLMIICFAFLKFRPRFFEHKRLLCWAMAFSFILCFCISLYFTITYNSSVVWQQQLNSLLGGRLQLGRSSLAQSGVPLFGQRMEFVGAGLDAYGNKNTNPYNYVDSFYIQIIQRYGLIFSAIWIGILTYTLYRCYKMKDYSMMVCLTFIALHCVIDDLSLALYYNTFWFAVVFVFVKTKKVEFSKKVTSPADIRLINPD